MPDSRKSSLCPASSNSARIGAEKCPRSLIRPPGPGRAEKAAPASRDKRSVLLRRPLAESVDVAPVGGEADHDPDEGAHERKQGDQEPQPLQFREGKSWHRDDR